MKSIGNRLQYVMSLVKSGSHFCDVGADHGYLGRRLLDEDKVGFVQLVENKIGPYKAMERHLHDYLDSNKLELTLGDGLERLDETVSVVSITGLGGDTIAKIINDSASKINNVSSFIIGAQTKPFLVRITLFRLGFRISLEKVIEESGKLYLIMFFEKGEQRIDNETVYYGTLKTKNDAHTLEYITKQKRIIDRIQSEEDYEN